MGEVKVLTSKRDSWGAYFKRIWKYRSLIRVLAVRDIKVEYSQTFLGMAWALLKPMVALFIYSVFFYWILNINTDPIPYPLFVLPGIMAWFHFTAIINEAGTSLKNNPDLIQKIDFPKMVLPLSKVVVSMVEVGITLVLLFITMVVFGWQPGWSLIAFPLFLMLNIITGMSVALWLAALTFRYRDLHHLIPYLVSFGIWVTPVFYPTTILPAGLETAMYFNPVAAVLAGYRWALLGDAFPHLNYLYSFIPVVLLFVFGCYYFIRIEDDIVDHV